VYVTLFVSFFHYPDDRVVYFMAERRLVIAWQLTLMTQVEQQPEFL
jgi:hypothetical protein